MVSEQDERFHDAKHYCDGDLERKRGLRPNRVAPSSKPCSDRGADGRGDRCRELGEHRSTLEEAARHAGWTIEHVGAMIAVRDFWTENEDHAAWRAATKVGLPLERVTVWAERAAESEAAIVLVMSQVQQLPGLR
jgi:hypothetical protein